MCYGNDVSSPYLMGFVSGQVLTVTVVLGEEQKVLVKPAPVVDVDAKEKGPESK